MKLVIFPGTRPKCKVWANEVAGEVKNDFEKVVVYEYLHWENQGVAADLGLETERARLMFSEMDNYVVMAKSVGVILCIKGVFEGWLLPKGSVFVGTPIHSESRRDYNLDQWFGSDLKNTMFIQQTSDPVTSYLELCKYLDEVGAYGYNLLEIRGGNHEYEDVGLLASKIKYFR